MEQRVEKMKALRTRPEEGAEAVKSLRTPLHFLDGGSMAKYADAFFNLQNMEVKEAFLDAINIRNGNDKNDLGICSTPK
jgi:hypothetical protein